MNTHLLRPFARMEKEIGFSRAELEAEIAALLARQHRRCALISHLFKAGDPNPHLRASLDRIDSGRGYVAGNLQVVTRAANFFKSASDAEDWALKAKAMEKMAFAMQQARKAKTDETCVLPLNSK